MMITSPGHVPRRGHRDAVTRLVTCRFGPCLEPERADAWLRPERPMGVAGVSAVGGGRGRGVGRWEGQRRWPSGARP